jgi:hypothetical protein
MCIKEWHRVHVKAACISIKLGSVSGSCSSPPSLLPHPRDQRTTHKCHPFSPAAPPKFFTWLRCGIMCLLVLIVWAGYRYYTFQKNYMISLHFLRNDSVGWSLLPYISKTSVYFHYFFSETIILWIFWVGTEITEWLMRENDTLRNNASDIIIHCLYEHCARTREYEWYFQEKSALLNGG